ncbi:RNA polymerase factor sigma-54 [Pectinatus frisingensis]|uniref:RNA polymerase factor sigma-54 n=1 Tax=Pectinatus frisingensis TaxID=865 RepID=UPI0018C4DE88|nr:RNA polymerase factor sigma-54 [Pectinatus frisingensis]
MKQDLALNIKQKLIMTPRMQQSVKILQMSSQDLHAAIEEEYNENPTLEFAELKTDSDSDIRQKLTVDDIKKLAEFLDNGKEGHHSSTAADDEYDFTIPAEEKNLADYLYEQVGWTFTDTKKRNIADYIIGCIDDCGYLTATLEDIAALTQNPVDEIEAILQIIQSFEPAGVGARNLSECLRLQARRLAIYNGLTAVIIDKYLLQLAKNQLKIIAQAENADITDVQKAVAIIKKLTPKPGAAYGNEQIEHIIPDVTVRQIDGKYVVLVNEYTVPSLRISELYRNTHNMDAQTKKYVEQRVNSAIWLINSIEQRRQTLFNVASQIVLQQKDFFDNGYEYLRPLSMKTIAEILGIHESTVSRAIANKYMETPHGIISIRKFFPANAVSTTTGEEMIAAKIKTVIKNLIEGENSAKPLSDQKICDLLQEQAIDISRRTVMKYREQLGYQSSTVRKQYI